MMFVEGNDNSADDDAYRPEDGHLAEAAAS